MATSNRDLITLAKTLTTCPAEAAHVVAARLGSGLDCDMAEALATLLAPLTAEESQPFRQSASPTMHMALALAAQRGRDNAGALVHANRAIEMSPRLEPLALALRGRLQHDLGDGTAARRDMQLALSLRPGMDFHLRQEKFVGRLMQSTDWQPIRTLKVALLAPFTTTLLTAPLVASGFGLDLRFELYQGEYGTWRQQILDPASGLYAFAPDIVVLMPPDIGHWPQDGCADAARATIDETRALWSTVLGRLPCHVVQVGLNVPAESGWGGLEDQRPEGRRRQVLATNLALSESLPSAVSFLDPHRAGGALNDPEQWSRFRQWPATPAIPDFCALLAAHIRGVAGLTSKVLVLDLDNTLWGGIIGEDSLSGIVVGPPDPVGEAYQAIQAYAAALNRRGILLAVCSKNNLNDAETPFLKHDAMILKRDDFVAFVANWTDKASNIRAMAEHLSLGLDSFVFLDDNPLERAWVRANLPQVRVIEGGSNPWEMLAALKASHLFETIALTAEDTARQDSYRSRAILQRLQDGTGQENLQSFLEGLGMVGQCQPVDAANLTRVTQLINKTNQFNLTTRRYTEQQVQAMAASDQWWCRGFRLSDRFGDHGLIGVILARRDTFWQVDSWLMSCRVLGRRMEEFMLAHLLSAAAADGAQGVRAGYVPTAKNALVAELLPRLGFVEDAEGTVWDLKRTQPPACVFIAGGPS